MLVRGRRRPGRSWLFYALARSPPRALAPRGTTQVFWWRYGTQASREQTDSGRIGRVARRALSRKRTRCGLCHKRSDDASQDCYPRPPRRASTNATIEPVTGRTCTARDKVACWNASAGRVLRRICAVSRAGSRTARRAWVAVRAVLGNSHFENGPGFVGERAGMIDAGQDARNAVSSRGARQQDSPGRLEQAVRRTPFDWRWSS